jgi:serine/threonine-protein kinase
VSASLSSIRVVPASGQAIRGVGNYRYIAMLAEGGMADVYLAVTKNAGFEKLVVIKQLRESLAADPTFVAMFVDEARLAARLNHPNVVQTLEVGTDELTGLHFIAMEFLEGVAHVRFARLKERVPSPVAFHIRILVDVLRGLHYAHELRDFDGKPLNVVHRDVSPQNVMLTFAGGVKVLDFGIAKAALATEQRPEDFKGKLEYMAPEQAARDAVDRRADVFSVGVMLFEALTRRRLYRKGDDKLALLLEGSLPSVLDFAPGTPKRLAAICAKGMAHDPDARYATADAMADDLEEWLGSTTQHVTARDVGSCIAEKFAPTRAKISAAIEAQLALFRAAAADDPPETIPLSRLPFTDIPAADLSEPPPPLSIPPALVPTIPSNPPPTGWSAQSSASVPTMTPRTTTASVPIVYPPQTPLRPPETRRKTGLVIAAGLAAAVALGGIAVFASQLRGKKPSRAAATLAVPGASSMPAAPSAAAPPPGEEAQIDLTIKASPPEARIFVDGKALSSNPASAKRPRDGAIHLVRIEAPGYEPREESLGFDRSAFMALDLHPVPPAMELPSAAVRSSRGGRPTVRGQRPGTSGAKLDTE